MKIHECGKAYSYGGAFEVHFLSDNGPPVVKFGPSHCDVTTLVVEPRTHLVRNGQV